MAAVASGSMIRSDTCDTIRNISTLIQPFTREYDISLKRALTRAYLLLTAYLSESFFSAKLIETPTKYLGMVRGF